MYYELQGRRQLTDRWTGTCRIRSCSGTKTVQMIRVEFLQEILREGIELQRQEVLNWKDTYLQFNLQ